MKLKNPPKPLPSAEQLNKLLRYDRETGTLFWRKQIKGSGASRFNKRWAGKDVGLWTAKGRALYLKVLGRAYAAHRVIWKMEYGVDPLHIDHIDGDPTNNKLENLRDVTPSENHRNRRVPSNNTSGVIGVSRRSDGKWRACCTIDERTLVLGDFLSIEEAIAARQAYEKIAGFHPNHGRNSAPSKASKPAPLNRVEAG